MGKFIIWYKQIKNKNTIEALNNCNENIFPSIYRILIILATLPFTFACSERFFSKFWNFTLYLQSENRLNYSAVMNIRRDISVSKEDVMRELSITSINRRTRLM